MVNTCINSANTCRHFFCYLINMNMSPAVLPSLQLLYIIRESLLHAYNFLFWSLERISKMRSGLFIFRTIRKRLMGVHTIFDKLNMCPFSATATVPDADDEYGLSRHDIPEDVKEGHFVVHTLGGGLKRFIIELSSLAHPRFLHLLQLAEEEFGFKQEGVLVVPCGPIEFERILESMKVGRA